MELSKILSISGLGGLFHLESQRDNGLIVRPLEGGKTRFVSSRKHLFTPLENITIYTLDDSIPLKEVFEEMKKKSAELPLPEPKSDGAVLHEYMKAVIPDYDDERVYTSDIRKIVKWYIQLDGRGLVVLDEEEEGKESSEEDRPEAEDSPKES